MLRCCGAVTPVGGGFVVALVTALNIQDVFVRSCLRSENRVAFREDRVEIRLKVAERHEDGVIIIARSLMSIYIALAHMTPMFTVTSTDVFPISNMRNRCVARATCHCVSDGGLENTIGAPQTADHAHSPCERGGTGVGLRSINGKNLNVMACRAEYPEPRVSNIIL